MANTLTSLFRDAYAAMEIVSRESVGIVQAVTRNVTADAASKGTTVRNPVAPKNAKYSITPSMTPLAAADMVYTNRTITLDNLEGYKFHFTSEEEMGLKASGPFETLWQQNIAQGVRVLTNAISTSLTALYYNASRAYGTAGTNPFATNIKPLSAAKTILDVNGAPIGDRHCVLSHASGYNLLGLTQLTNVDQAGENAALRQGVVRDLFGFQVRLDANIKTHTVGTSTGQDCTAIEPVGETSITYDGGDSGTILQGDTISLAAATDDPAKAASKYVINETIAHDETTGTIKINAPGLLTATTVGQEIALGSTNYEANLCFSRDALVLAARAPQGGDAAVSEMFITDPLTGLTFRIAKYAGHHLVNYEMSVLYGVGLGNPEHMAILMG